MIPFLLLGVSPGCGQAITSRGVYPSPIITNITQSPNLLDNIHVHIPLNFFFPETCLTNQCPQSCFFFNQTCLTDPCPYQPPLFNQNPLNKSMSHIIMLIWFGDPLFIFACNPVACEDIAAVAKTVIQSHQEWTEKVLVILRCYKILNTIIL